MIGFSYFIVPPKYGRPSRTREILIAMNSSLLVCARRGLFHYGLAFCRWRRVCALGLLFSAVSAFLYPASWLATAARTHPRPAIAGSGHEQRSPRQARAAVA